jgi:hypothetical protein
VIGLPGAEMVVGVQIATNRTGRWNFSSFSFCSDEAHGSLAVMSQVEQPVNRMTNDQ